MIFCVMLLLLLPPLLASEVSRHDDLIWGLEFCPSFDHLKFMLFVFAAGQLGVGACASFTRH